MKSDKNTNYLDELKSRINIVDVIGRYVHLEKHRSNWLGLCPFHDDKNPSLSVSEKLQLFNCFACGTKGDVFSFVKKIKNVSYSEAIKSICDNFNIEMNNNFLMEIKKKSETTQKSLPYWDACKLIRRIYHGALLRAIAENDRLVISFLNERKLTPELLSHFEIGFAPPLLNFLTKKVINETEDELEKNRLDNILHELGYIDEKNHDFFHNRIIFPILNAEGNVVGFSGRSLTNDTGAKYLNSKESIIFKKNEVLFNFYDVKKINPEKIYLTEGFMEVVSLWKIGIKNAVAIMGTSFTKEQLKLLEQLNKLEEVILCLDRDPPGQEASIGVARELIKHEIGKNKKKWEVSLLPDFPNNATLHLKDLDEFIRHVEKEKVFEYLETSASFFVWYTNYLTKKTNINDPSLKKETVARKILSEITSLAHFLVSPSEHVDALANALGIQKQELYSAYKKLKINLNINKKEKKIPPLRTVTIVQKKSLTLNQRIHQMVGEEFSLNKKQIGERAEKEQEKGESEEEIVSLLDTLGRNCFIVECKILIFFFNGFRFIEFCEKMKENKYSFVFEKTRKIYQQLEKNTKNGVHWDLKKFLNFILQNDFDNHLLFDTVFSIISKGDYKYIRILNENNTLNENDELNKKQEKIIQDLLCSAGLWIKVFGDFMRARSSWGFLNLVFLKNFSQENSAELQQKKSKTIGKRKSD